MQILSDLLGPATPAWESQSTNADFYHEVIT